MITWSRFTIRPRISHGRRISFKGRQLTCAITSSMWLMLDLSISSIPRPYLHMLGSPNWPQCYCCLARPYLHMLGLPNPSSCEHHLLCGTPNVCYVGHKGEHECWYYLGIILVYATIVYPILASFKMYDHGGTKSTVFPFKFVSSWWSSTTT